MFLSEILKVTIKEEESNLPLFQFLESSLLWLDKSPGVANFHLLFLLKLTGYLGFSPDFGSAPKPWFNLMEGVFQEEREGSYCETGIVVEVLYSLQFMEFDQLLEKNISKGARMETLAALMNYYKLHVQGFQAPKSLSILSQLFN